MPPAASFASVYRPDIDGLRALAVLAVLFFHLRPAALPGGFIGVDLFFVISGYLISQILYGMPAKNQAQAWKHFFAQRMRRLLPALCVVTLATLSMAWWLLLGPEFRLLGQHAMVAPGFGSNLLLWREAGYFDAASDLKPLLHLWSLGVEAQFYVLWPLALWLVSNKRPRARTLLLSVLAGVSLGYCLLSTHYSPTGAFYSPLTRMWEFLAGGALAWFERGRVDLSLAGSAPQKALSSLRELSAWVGLGLVLTAMFTFNRDLAYPGFYALMPVLGAVLLIASGPAAALNRYGLSQPCLVWIGLISYPLYLWHWPLISLVRGYLRPDAGLVVQFSVALASLILAYGTWRWIERPIRRWRGAPGLIMLGLSSVGLMLIGALIWQGVIPTRQAAATSAVQSAPATSQLLNTWTKRWAAWWREGDLSTQALPPPATPAQIAALEPFDSAYRQSCTPWTHQPYNDDWCNAGTLANGVEPQVLLMGDSHANHYAVSLAAVAQHSSLSFYQLGRGQCPMLVDYGPPACRALFEVALRQLARQPTIHTVALAAAFKDYASGKSWVDEHLQADPAAFQTALEKTVARLQASGRRVVILMSVPGGASPRGCVSRGGAPVTPAACTLTRARAEQDDNGARAFLKRFAQAHPALEWFDPWPHLCNQSTCQMREGNTVLYADGSHLSSPGARLLGERADAELRSLFRLPPVKSSPVGESAANQ